MFMDENSSSDTFIHAAQHQSINQWMLEYTILCRGVRPLPQVKVCPGHDHKLHLMMSLQFWRPGECEVVGPIYGSSRFKNYLYLIRLLSPLPPKKQI